MKFLVDMPVTPQAVAYLEARGHDAVHASQIGLGSQPDSEILERAFTEDRIVVTADLDYPRLLALLKLERPGVIVFRGGSYSDAEMLALLDRVLFLERILTLLSEEGIRYCVIGGQAVNAYVEPVVSLNLDLAVPLADLPRVESHLRDRFRVERFPA